MGEKLIEWVTAEYQQRGWTMNELARRGGLSSAYVSHVLSGRSQPGPKFFQGVSRAFEITLESVEQLNANGQTPTPNPNEPLTKDLVEIAKLLPLEDLLEVRDYALYRLRRSKNTPPKPL